MGDSELDILDLVLLDGPRLLLGDMPEDQSITIDPPLAYDGSAIYFRTNERIPGFADGIQVRRLFFELQREVDPLFEDQDDEELPACLYGCGLLSLLVDPHARRHALEQLKLRTVGTAMVIRTMTDTDAHAWSLEVRSLSRLPLAAD